jgi:phosphoribosyl-ATP pyrophosphohydrolase
VRHRSRSIVRESADLVYHLVVLWHDCGITPDEVWAEMRRRADRAGIAEKLPKGSGSDAPAAGFGK